MAATAGRGRSRETSAILALFLVLTGLGGWLSLTSLAAPVNVTIPYVEAPVALGDLDGNPATGDWAGALSVAVSLENGEAGLYGTATFRAKHDGVRAFFRLDGAIDVPWTSATGNHFWVGMIVSRTGTSHHAAGTWDGVFFGLWNGADYAPVPVRPPTAVDTADFNQPPSPDASQDIVGFLNYSGSVAPYSYTAEWSRLLDTGDTSDLTYVADGTTSYNFFVTTDSDGDGSSGGVIAHNQVTNLNTMRFAAPSGGNLPPTVRVLSPSGGSVWTGGEVHLITWTMDDDLTPPGSLVVWVNRTGDAGDAPIAGPLVGATSHAWTVPPIDGVDVWINVTVVDEFGARAWDLAPIPIVDAVPVDRQAPPSPQATVTAEGGPGCLRLYWTPVNATDVHAFRIYRWNGTNGPMVFLTEVTSDVYTHTDCEDVGSVRSYWITAVDTSENESPPSPMVTGFVSAEAVDAPPPPIPWDGLVLALGIAIILLGAGTVGRRGRGRDR